jgi:hypothetical protein
MTKPKNGGKIKKYVVADLDEFEVHSSVEAAKKFADMAYGDDSTVVIAEIILEGKSESKWDWK